MHNETRCIFGYICLGVSSLEESIAFYDAILAPLGLKRCETENLRVGMGGLAGASMTRIMVRNMRCGYASHLTGSQPATVMALWWHCLPRAGLQ